MANKQNRGYGEEMGKMENWRKTGEKSKKMQCYSRAHWDSYTFFFIHFGK